MVNATSAILKIFWNTLICAYLAIVFDKQNSKVLLKSKNFLKRYYPIFSINVVVTSYENFKEMHVFIAKLKKLLLVHYCSRINFLYCCKFMQNIRKFPCIDIWYTLAHFELLKAKSVYNTLNVCKKIRMQRIEFECQFFMKLE